MRRAALLAIVALLAVSLVASGPVGATPTHEDTIFEIEIQEEGDAVWTISTSYALENESDLAAFDEIRAEHESEADPSPNPDLFRAATEQVAAETGRSMQIQNVNLSSTVKTRENDSVGVLRLSFTWTNFAVVTEDQVSVEAAFAGGWFGDLAANQTLSIQPPPDYRPLRANPSTDIDDGELQWDGPQPFGPDEPTVVFEAFKPAAGLLDLLSPMVAGIGAAVLGIALLVGWRKGYIGRSEGATVENGEPETATEAAPDAPDRQAPEAATSEPDDGTEAAPTATAVDTDLLSDEERVEHLLRQNDGRMKQARIVEETRWSNAKVSQLLSAMAEAGRIEKLRIGRENLISLPEEETEE
ncbi:MAG: helix-turn-helix transcriptional regulator [Halodesulfurarchaeum sp.]